MSKDLIVVNSQQDFSQYLDPKCCSECKTLREDINKITDILKAFDDRLTIIEDIIEENAQIADESGSDEESVHSARLLRSDPVNIDSADDKSPASVALEWKDYSQRQEQLFKRDPPKVGIKYTGLEHDSFILDGYDVKTGFWWMNWKNDEGASWWQLREKR